MGVALEMSHNEKSVNVSEGGRRAASHFAAYIGQQLRQALQKQDVFRPHELDAIVDSYVEVLLKSGNVTEEKLAKALHSRAIPNDLAVPLAHALSGER
ncbi:hypothetical protein R2G56_08400 [Nitratireductor aquimarinus]|uniref:Uncharacterized protein n=1 Tax=Nitratireductor aquimarinus TaxID=889300 RepID=A0ABU4AJ81_9HYPH|nr:hypothetical protein [Nitratireductor aquimarinus]MDV6226304.1 hypothetical protein [Nitratireductor aquimarinus]